MPVHVLSKLLGAGALLHFSLTSAYPAVRSRSPNTIALREVIYNGTSPLARRDDIQLAEDPKAHYIATINIGSSQTPVDVLLDTGSADLVINPASVPNDGSVTSDNAACAENYGGRGAQSGNMFSMPYSYAGFQTSGHFCEIALASGIAGVLGIGFPRPPGGPGVSSQTGQNPLMQFVGQGLDSFAIYLSDTPGGGGAFTPNDYDQAFINGNAPFAQENVDWSSSHWNFALAGTFEYEGASHDLGLSTGMVDSGTPSILVPQAAASQIWSLVGADATGSYGSNCNPGGDPITIIAAGGNRYDIPAAVYVIQNPNGDGTCINAFRPKPNNQNPAVVLGAPFMRAFYTYFDVANHQLNFAASGG